MQPPISPTTSSTMRRRLPLVGGLLAAALLVVSACGAAPTAEVKTPSESPSASATAATEKPTDGSQPTESVDPSSNTSTESPADEVKLSSNINDGAKAVKVSTLVRVKATGGTVGKVTLAYSAVVKGRTEKGKVSGTLSADKTTWTADDRLEPSAKYTLSMAGTGGSGEVSKKASFSTQDLTMKQQTFPSIYPKEGATVGVGMPVVLTFDVPIKNKADFEKNLHVTSKPAQEGTWSWFSDTQVHYRPKEYWKPGTKISVDAAVNGIAAGDGVYGQKSTSTEFTIGRSVITKIDLDTHQTKVYVKGKLAKTIPISGGKPGFTTRSGTKLIMDKMTNYTMASETIGIAENSSEGYNLKVAYAMRLTNSGEFIHSAPWNASKFGRVNGSHGCVGMSNDNADWLWGTVMIGDPVVTTGSNRKLEKGNGWSDWDISYSEFAKGSAI